MELIAAFCVFIALMLGSIALKITMLAPLLAGIMMFSAFALRRGFPLREVGKMLLRGGRDSLVVVRIVLLIGCLTGLWRHSGTIACLTYWGVRCVPPRMFLLSAFLLSAVMSYLLGTSFGVTATAGVILIAIARAGDVSPVLAGGAILSGVYFGDRSSPAASCASLVANVTGTKLQDNLRPMLRTAAVPMLLCAVLYGVLSLFNGMDSADVALLEQFEAEFSLSLWCAAPAILLLVLAFAGLRIEAVMLIDIVVSFALTMLVQSADIWAVLRSMLLGYVPANAALTEILSGGGASSMLEIAAILLLSSAVSGVFEGTQMLGLLEDRLKKWSGRIGRFPVMVVSSLGISAVFCNQTIGVIMCRQCMSRTYGEDGVERQALMLDMEDSIVPLASVVPWCISCSVPLTMLECDYRSTLLAFFLFLLPLWHFICSVTGRKHHKGRSL